MAERMMLIAGRTSKQGTSLNAGKLEDEYLEVTSTGEMNSADMARLGLKDGDRMRLRSPEGEVVVSCVGKDPGDLPAGVIFIPYGPPSSRLMGSDTACTGMPISKNIEVEVEPLGEPGPRPDPQPQSA